jgi:flagellar hook-associated protein 1 FlgK
MSLFSLLGVAGDALTAQSGGLGVTGANVANVNTPGYVRRTPQLAARSTAAGSQGGVDFNGVGRMYDRFASARWVEEGGKQASADERLSALSQLQAIVAPGAGQGISDRLQAMFDSLHQLSASPSDPTARAAVLARAQDLANTMSSTAGSLADERSKLLGRAQGVVSETNDRLKQIAGLNEKIANAQAAGDPAADMRDRRDQLVNEVAQRIDAKAVEDPTGRITLLSAGSTLVDGNNASTLSVGLDNAGAMKIAVNRPGGQSIDVTAQVNGGALGGIREARDVDVPAAQTKLDKLAYDVANAVNAVHANGAGLDGVSGRPLFTPPGQVPGAAYVFAVDPAMVGHPERLAASATAAGLPGDGSNALALAQLGDANLSNGDTPVGTAAGIAAGVGLEVQAATSESALRKDTVAQANEMVQRASGVSLDEEMVNMTRFQRAFDASTQVLKVADSLLSDLIASKV